MADYGFIARGVQPIDIASPLLQVEQIRQARAQEQRQNELLALRRQEMDASMAAVERERVAAEELKARTAGERKAKGGLALAQTLMQYPYESLMQNGQPPPELQQVFNEYGVDLSSPEAFRSSTRRIELQSRAFLGEAPKAPEIGTLYQVVDESGQPKYVPAAAAVNQRAYRAPPASTVVRVGENAYDTAVGKDAAETYTGIQAAARSANTKIARLGQMEDLLGQIETGALAPAKAQVAAVSEALGFPIDPSLDSKQAFESLTNQMALEMRNPSGGAGMPGALSDKDREFLTATVPGLGKTNEGNRQIIQIARALAKRDQEVAQLARDYAKRNGRFDEGFYDELAVFSAQNPLFAESSSSTESAPVKVNSVTEAMALPSGTLFVTPDGKLKVRP